MAQIVKLLEEFMTVKEERVIYNEFSLQFELGFFFREKGFNVFFERNVKTLNNLVVPNKEEWTKHEIDLLLLKDNQYYAIELKFPRNGEYPEQMYQFLKDIRFMEQVKDWTDVARTYALTVTRDPLFYNNSPKKPKDNLNHSIYDYFRYGKIIEANGIIGKPTGTNKSPIKMARSHGIEWKESNAPWNFLDKKRTEGTLHYYIVSC